jgi:hypothetical protein
VDPGLPPGWLSTSIGVVQPLQAAPTLPINLEDRLGSSARMGRINHLVGVLIAVNGIDLKH